MHITSYMMLTRARTEASTTPPGSPPPGLLASIQGKLPAASAPVPQNGSSILEALANIARQNTSAPASAPSLPTPAVSYNVPPAATGLPQPVSSSMSQLPPQPPASYPQTSQPAVNPPSSLPFSLAQALGQTALPNSAPNGASNLPNPAFPGAPAAAGAAGSAGFDTTTQQQIMLIKALADQGVPFDKIPALIQSMTGAGNPAAPVSQGPTPVANGSYGVGQQPWATATGSRPDEAREWGGYKDGRRSPPRYRDGRTRSRSPDRGWAARGSPRGRDRVDFARNSPARGRDDDRNGRRGGEYRNRSPPRRHGQSPPSGEKWTDFDPNLRDGCIKVLSRTLFVGGVTCSEPELKSIFTRYGTVQTCIVNKDKRHAFVKMLTRKDAISAKENTEDNRTLEVPLRVSNSQACRANYRHVLTKIIQTRWGVGFGPRDCSDYATGISIIPIHRLTEADRKWMLTAPHGGSGGRPIETGLVVEEPDIEIGAGVSSKAISRRMQTDKSGSNGPKSSRHRDEGWRGDGGDLGLQNEHHDEGLPKQPGVANFPFGLGTLPNGMPNFPAGFSFPDPSANAGKWA
jgi:protein NRD1